MLPNHTAPSRRTARVMIDAVRCWPSLILIVGLLVPGRAIAEPVDVAAVVRDVDAGGAARWIKALRPQATAADDARCALGFSYAASDRSRALYYLEACGRAGL